MTYWYVSGSLTLSHSIHARYAAMAWSLVRRSSTSLWKRSMSGRRGLELLSLCGAQTRRQLKAGTGFVAALALFGLVFLATMINGFALRSNLKVKL